MPADMRCVLHDPESPRPQQLGRKPGVGSSNGVFGTTGVVTNGPGAFGTRGAPQRRDMSLGLRLGLLVTLIVAGVMAAVTATQLTLELRTELRERQSLLAASLSPLVAQLRAASTREDAKAAVQRFHFAYLDGGHAHHYLAVVDSDGRVLVASGAQGAEPALLTSSVSLAVPAFGPGRVELLVTQDSSRFLADRSRRWRSWAVHVGLTALLILSLLFVVIRREITGPIERLLWGIRKMELGYWADMPDPGGAWELRWLGWRFRTLGHELNSTVEHLVAAQKRAYAAGWGAQAEHQPSTSDGPGQTASLTRNDAREALKRLHARLESLRRANPRDAEARMLAQITWHCDAPQAERLGQPGLRMALEDAALRVLEPDECGDIEQRIEAQRPRLNALVEARSADIHGALGARGVPVLEISHRIKHTAGIWKKMREKELALDQVHDLVALRIVVPTEVDCYHALGVVHDMHAPLVGRFKDYIAQPKPNGYRSLHTSVRSPDGSVFEVQIRSIAMHQLAEHGQASHAGYKEARWIPANPGRGGGWKRLLGVLMFSKPWK